MGSDVTCHVSSQPSARLSFSSPNQGWPSACFPTPNQGCPSSCFPNSWPRHQYQSSRRHEAKSIQGCTKFTDMYTYPRRLNYPSLWRQPCSSPRRQRRKGAWRFSTVTKYLGKSRKPKADQLATITTHDEANSRFSQLCESVYITTVLTSTSKT